MNNIRLVEKPQFKAAAVKVSCTSSEFSTEIPKAFVELDRLLNGTSGFDNRVRLGIFMGLPENADFNADKLDYFACSECTEQSELPEGMEHVTIPAFNYAVIRHKGPISKINDAFESLHGWLDEQGYQKGRHHIEVYGEHYDGSSENSEMEIMVPITK